MHSCTGESQRLYAEGKASISKGYIHCNSIYMTFCKDETLGAESR